MSMLFKLDGAVRKNPAIDAWFAKQAPELGAVARGWYARVRERGAGVGDVMHDGCPTACVQGAAFCYVGVFKGHVSVGFFHGAELADPAGLLLGSGRRMRHVKLIPGADVDALALEALIAAAHADIERRLEAEGADGPLAGRGKGHARRSTRPGR